MWIYTDRRNSEKNTPNNEQNEHAFSDLMQSGCASCLCPIFNFSFTVKELKEAGNSAVLNLLLTVIPSNSTIAELYSAAHLVVLCIYYFLLLDVHTSSSKIVGSLFLCLFAQHSSTTNRCSDFVWRFANCTFVRQNFYWFWIHQGLLPRFLSVYSVCFREFRKIYFNRQRCFLSFGIS